MPASTDVLDRSEIRDTNLRVNLSESLTRVPGLVVLNRQNYAQDLQISVRGFGARSTFGVRGVRLYVDGIPATMPDGQGQVSHFALNAAERIEVLRGPFSALYGNSSGGVISMTTRLAPGTNEIELSGAAGSDKTWRAGISARGGTAPYAYAIDASRFATDGFRDYSQATRDVINLRAGVLDTPVGRLRITLNALDIPEAEDPLGLTRAQVQDNPRQASPQALQFRTRKSTEQQQLGALLAGDFAQRWSYQASAWGGRREVTQFQAIPLAVQANPDHPGGVIDLDRSYGGVDARAQWMLDATTFTFGINLERLDEDRRGFENFTVEPPMHLVLGTQGRLRRDERNVVESRDVYLQGDTALGRWRLHAGLRASQVDFRGTDRFRANGDDSGDARYDAVNPTVGAVFRPASSTSLYASYGRGFETPTLNELAYRPDGSAGFNTALEAARSHNVELGAKAATRAWRATLAAFAVETDNDIVVRTNVGGRSTFANVAATRRRGVEASLGWEPLAAWSLYASMAAIRAEFAETFFTCSAAPCTQPTVPVAAGNRLPGVPAYTAYAEARYRMAAADLTFEMRAQSSLPVDDRNTDEAAGYAAFNLALARNLVLGPVKVRAFARVDNVFDARTIGSVIVNEGNGRYFEPAPGRTWLAGLDARF